MIQKPKTKYAYARRFFALPIMFTIAFAYMVNAENKEIEKQNEQIQTIADLIKNKEKNSSITHDTISDEINGTSEYKANDIFIFNGKKVSQEIFSQKKAEFNADKNYYFSANKNFLSNDLPIIYVGGKNKNVKKDDQFIGKIVAVVWDTPAAEKVRYSAEANNIPYEEQLNNAHEKALFVINAEIVSKKKFEQYYQKNKNKTVAFTSNSHINNDKDHWVFGEREQYGVFEALDYSKASKENVAKFHQLVKKINPKWYYEQYINQKYTARENEIKRQNGEKENTGKIVAQEVKVAAKRDYDKNPLTQAETKELRDEAQRLQAKVEKQSQINRDNMIIFKSDLIASYVSGKDQPLTKDKKSYAPVNSNTMVMTLRDGQFFIDGKEYTKEEIKMYMKGYEEEMFGKEKLAKAPFKSVKMYRTPYGDKGFSKLDKMEFFTK